MVVRSCTMLAALAMAASLGSVQAADLTGAEIKSMITGNTVYLETTGDSVTGKPGQGVIHYQPDGTSLYKTPMGVMWHGKWEIKDNTNCTNWAEGTGLACNRYDKVGDVISIIDGATGKTRAKIVKTAAGNAEKLAP